MPDNDTILQAARSLFAQYQANETFTALPGPWSIETIPQAYAVQREYLRFLAEVQGKLAGYKLAYTTATMQQRAGWHEPCAGAPDDYHHLPISNNFEGSLVPAVGNGVRGGRGASGRPACLGRSIHSGLSGRGCRGSYGGLRGNRHAPARRDGRSGTDPDLGGYQYIQCRRRSRPAGH